MDFEDFRKEWENESEVIECRTSGSTGSPQIIRLPKEQMKRSAERSCRFFGISDHSLLYSCVGADFIGGKMVMVRSEVSGAKFLYESPTNRPLENYHGPHIALLSLVPSQMIHLLDHPELTANVSHFLIGGAAIPSGLRQRIIDSGISAWESYGMTETSSHVALRKVEQDNEWFTTLPGISVETYSEEGKLAIDIEGWRKFLTNDIAEVVSPSSFRILGRADNVINSGGKKIYPEEVERTLSSIFPFPFFISSRHDEKWGEATVMAVAETDMPEDKIILKCKSLLPGFMVPKSVLKLDKIPLTPNGKLKRIKF